MGIWIPINIGTTQMTNDDEGSNTSELMEKYCNVKPTCKNPPYNPYHCICEEEKV